MMNGRMEAAALLVGQIVKGSRSQNVGMEAGSCSAPRRFALCFFLKGVLVDHCSTFPSRVGRRCVCSPCVCVCVCQGGDGPRKIDQRRKKVGGQTWCLYARGSSEKRTGNPRNVKLSRIDLGVAKAEIVRLRLMRRRRRRPSL